MPVRPCVFCVWFGPFCKRTCKNKLQANLNQSKSEEKTVDQPSCVPHSAQIQTMALNTLDARPDALKAKDASRKPQELLAFAGLAPEHRVLDVGTLAGYWAEFAASISTQRVDCQNGLEWQPLLEKWGILKSAERLEKLEKKYRFFLSPMNDPANGAKESYDLVICYCIYHHLFPAPIDRKKFLESIAGSLVKGSGRLLLVDHRAGEGRGEEDTGAHRIEEALARKQVIAAGFEIEKESDLLTSSSDDLKSDATKGEQLQITHIYFCN